MGRPGVARLRVLNDLRSEHSHVGYRLEGRSQAQRHGVPARSCQIGRPPRPRPQLQHKPRAYKIPVQCPTLPTWRIRIFFRPLLKDLPLRTRSMIVNPTSSQASMVSMRRGSYVPSDLEADLCHERFSQAKDNTNEYDEHTQLPTQAPPSYETVVGNGGHSAYIPLHRVFPLSQTRSSPVSGQYIPESAAKAQDVKVPMLPTPNTYQVAGPPPSQAGQPPATVVYNYVNPLTGERIVSLLPPDHPQMICLQQGGHDTSSKFGILGESPRCLFACCAGGRAVLTAGCVRLLLRV